MAEEIDAEAKELLKRLQAVEERLLKDTELLAIVHKAVKTLQNIYGQKTDIAKILEDIKKSFTIDKPDKLMITATNATPWGKGLVLYKNSVIADFLADTNKISAEKLSEFHEYFESFGAGAVEEALKTDPERAKTKLKEYVKMLEEWESHVKEDMDLLLQDYDYMLNFHNVIAHELIHKVYVKQKQPHPFNEAYNEAHAYALQAFLYTYEEDFGDFNEDKLKKAIAGFYKNIEREKDYEKRYALIRPFANFLAALILSDSIARKEGDFRNQELLRNSYSVPTLQGLYTLVQEAVNNLKNEKFKKIINDMLIKAGKDAMKDCKKYAVTEIEEQINKINALSSTEKKTKGIRQPAKEKWESLRPGLVALSKINTYILNCIQMLDIMGEKKLAESFREKTLNAIQEKMNEILAYIKDKDKLIFEKEEHVIDAINKVIKEEKDLVDINKQLKK